MNEVTREEFEALRLELEYLQERFTSHRGMLAILLTMAPLEDRARLIADLQTFLAHDRKMNQSSGMLAEQRELIALFARAFEQFPFVRQPPHPQK